MTRRQLKIHTAAGLAGLASAALCYVADEDQNRRFFYVAMPIIYLFVFIYGPLAITLQAKYGRKYISDIIMENRLWRMFYIEDK